MITQTYGRVDSGASKHYFDPDLPFVFRVPHLYNMPQIVAHQTGGGVVTAGTCDVRASTRP
jgi:hypothetical protein